MAHPEFAKAKEYYQIKVVELLLYLNTMIVEDRKEVRPYYYKTQMEKIKGIHAQITGNPQTRKCDGAVSGRVQIQKGNI